MATEKKNVKLELKKDDSGNVVLSDDGFPVWIADDGKEFAYNVSDLVNNLSKANAESAGRRKQIDTLETENRELKEKYEGLDPEVAKKALDVVKNLEDKKIIEAGEVDKLKTSIKEGYELQMKQLKDSFETALKDKDGVVQTKDGQIRQLLIKNAFNGSQFLSEKTTLPPDVAYAYFGNHFEIREVNGELRAVGKIGNEDIMSRAMPGELASTEEAIEYLVERYPMKERILRGTGATGSGVFNPDVRASEQPQTLAEVMYPSMAKQK